MFSIYPLTLETNCQKEEKMSKKIPLTLFLTVVISIVGLFGATAVMAQDICQAGNQVTITPTSVYQYPLVINDTFTFEDTGDRAVCDVYPCNLWIIEASGPKSVMSKITQMTVYIPSLVDDPIIFRGGHPSATAGEPGDGGPNYYGAGIFNGIVVTIPAEVVNSRKYRFYFATARNTYGFNSLAYHTGTDKMVPCDPGLTIVGYEPSIIIPSEYVRTVNLPEGGCFRIHKHPVTGCIKEFRDCDGNLIPKNPDGPSWITKEVPDLGSFDEKLCRNAVITGKTGLGTDYEYWGYANGWWYCIGTWDTAGYWCNGTCLPTPCP
jgi:hypothetical protein